MSENLDGLNNLFDDLEKINRGDQDGSRVQ